MSHRGGVGEETPRVRAIRGITVPSDGGFQKLIVEAEAPMRGDAATELQSLISQLDRIIEGFKKDYAHAEPGVGAAQAMQTREDTGSPTGWKPWRNGRGESKPADADPDLAQFLEANKYRFGNRWASEDGYEYWLSTLNDGAKFIHRARRSRS